MTKTPTASLPVPGSPKRISEALAPSLGSLYAVDKQAGLDGAASPSRTSSRRSACALMETLVEPPSPTPTARKDGFFVQLASYSEAARAEQHRQQLRSEGHEATIARTQIPGRGTYYRISIGPFASWRAAETCRAELADATHADAWVRKVKRHDSSAHTHL